MVNGCLLSSGTNQTHWPGSLGSSGVLAVDLPTAFAGGAFASWAVLCEVQAPPNVRASKAMATTATDPIFSFVRNMAFNTPCVSAATSAETAAEVTTFPAATPAAASTVEARRVGAAAAEAI